MMNMAYGTAFGPMYGILCALCCIAMIALTVGIAFLVIWAAKNLTPAKLWTWGVGLAVAGGLVCLAVCCVSPQGGMMPYSAGKMVSMSDEKNMMMDCMMKKNDNENSENNAMMMDHSMGGMDSADSPHAMMNHDAMNMSMNDMSEMLKGKTGDDFDKAFLEGMIPHHQGAIDMAQEVLKSAKHAELRELATDIISAQQAEIDMMNKWMKDWGYTQ